MQGCENSKSLVGDKFSKLNLEIFSSKTGEWRASVASSPQSFNSLHFGLQDDCSFAYNGMLYWKQGTMGCILEPLLEPYSVQCIKEGKKTQRKLSGFKVKKPTNNSLTSYIKHFQNLTETEI